MPNNRMKRQNLQRRLIDSCGLYLHHLMAMTTVTFFTHILNFQVNKKRRRRSSGHEPEKKKRKKELSSALITTLYGYCSGGTRPKCKLHFLFAECLPGVGFAGKVFNISDCKLNVLQKHHYYLNKELTFWLHLWMCLTVFTFLFLTRRRKTKVPDGNGLHRAILQEKRDAVHHLQHITVDMYAEMAFFHFLQAPPNP